MNRSTNKLTDRAVRAFLAARRAHRAATGKLADGGGLFITTTPAGTAVWRVKYRYGGRERLHSVGVYPAVSLEAARIERDAVRALLKEGKDPARVQQVERATQATASDTTFQGVTASWLAKRKPEWSAIHYTTSKRALERDVDPFLGKLPIGEITPAMVAHVIEKIVQRKAVETAGKVLWNVTRIFELAKVRGFCRDNPAHGCREVIPKRNRGQRPALLDFASLGDLLRRAQTAHISPAVYMAHRLTAFTAARLGNIVAASWDEFQLEGDLPDWTIPRSKMKAKGRAFDHRIMLGESIASELRLWRQATGGRGWVFTSPTGNGSHITHESLEKAYRVTLKLEDKHSPHSWRSAFSTLARDAGFERDVVELALDHLHDSAVVRAYDRGARLAERLKLMRWWDSELSRAQHGADVIPIRAIQGNP